MEIYKNLLEKKEIQDNFNIVMEYLKTNDDIIIKNDSEVILDSIKIEECVHSLDDNFLNFLQKNELCFSLFFNNKEKK